ncbi:phosphotransferase enzyme family protein [Caulobacter sp. KR2-114]|uniref:phosphotransferase enzyme family protein n=1 Tax=Caulobacter sp. KR2-114 TaxID=3400912 RepID=UPI003BFC49F7
MVENGKHKPVYSTLSAASVVTQMEREYELHGPLEATLLHRGFSDTYLVSAKAARYVARVSRARRRDLHDVGWEVELVGQLKDAGVPVCGVLPTKAGRCASLVEAAEGNRPLVVFEWLGGLAPMRNEADSKAQGRTLASIHRDARPPDCTPNSHRSDSLSRVVGKAKTAIAALIGDSDQRVFLLEFGAWLERELSEIEPTLELGVLHGDCHGANARIDSMGVAHFFDFDDARLGPLIYDLAVFRSYCGIAPTLELRGLWGPFLEGYASVRMVPDLWALPYCVAARQFWLFGEYAHGANEGGRAWVEEWLPRHLKFLAAWRARELSGQRSCDQ